MGPSRTDVDNEQVRQVVILGTGAADPTLVTGTEVTVTHQATGVYRLTFTGGPGTFVGVRGYVFGAETPSAVKGYTLTRDTFTAATSTAHGFLDVSVWNSSFAAADLAATQYLDLALVFQA